MGRRGNYVQFMRFILFNFPFERTYHGVRLGTVLVDYGGED
jgi:hypothetical protein